MLSYLQEKWKLKSLLQVIAILCVFSLSGSTVVLLRPLFFELVGVGNNTSLIVKISLYILFIFPAYQLLLLGYGWIFGQQRFFLKKIKNAKARVFSKLNGIR